MSVLSGLKKFMEEHNVSVVDLDWNKLKENKIDMPKLLRWEMRNAKLTPNKVRGNMKLLKIYGPFGSIDLFPNCQYTIDGDSIILKRMRPRGKGTETVVFFMLGEMRMWICIYHSTKPFEAWYRIGKLKVLISGLPHLPYTQWKIVGGQKIVDRLKIEDRIMHPDAQV